MKNPSSSNFSFSKVSAPALQRSVFNRSTDHKTTIEEDWLYPLYVDEILPGDTVNMDAHIVARLTTLLTPVMDNMFLDMHWWFVPCRLLWEHWEPFMSGYSGRGEETDYEIPQLSGTDPSEVDFSPFSMGDYFGLPVGQTIDTENYGISALPFRAYYLIYNEWYRDQNLQDELLVPLDDGPDDPAIYSLQKRNKRPDYATTALPWPQKGAAVLMPLGSTAPVIGDGYGIGFDGGPEGNMVPTYTDDTGTQSLVQVRSGAPVNTPVGTTPGGGWAYPSQDHVFGLSQDPAKSHMFADLSAATSASINNIRLAVAMQQVLERDARGGTRYTEHLVSHWRVSAEDYRLQRPEYLGGSSDPMGVYQVPQTSKTETNSPQANLAAYGQMTSRSKFSKSFVEHGYVMCLVNFRADQTYQENIRRMWSRKTRWEFYLPDLAHLGEQPVKVGEICYNVANTDFNEVFGYQERWAEYRYFPPMVTGALRSQYAFSLDVWHLAFDFIGDAGTGLPALNSTFIKASAPIERIVAIDNSEGRGEHSHLVVDCFFRNRHARPMPVYSNPGLLRF